jgi:hypothetical protein
MAGFLVATYGRFGVATEVPVEMDGRLLDYEDADNGSNTSARLFAGLFTSVETFAHSINSAGHGFSMAPIPLHLGLNPIVQSRSILDSYVSV